MKIPEHIACSFLLAQLGLHQQYGPGGTLLAVVAGCLPDLDGLTVVAGWEYHRLHHRVYGHGLPVTLAGPALLAWLGSRFLQLGPFWPLWLWLQIALLVHLVTDVLFYRWPVQLLWPFSRRGWGAGLVGWNDLVPTVVLYAGVALVLALPTLAAEAAAFGLGSLAAYLAWRAWRPRPQEGWAFWVAGGWARRSGRLWRWLTGDFVT